MNSVHLTPFNITNPISFSEYYILQKHLPRKNKRLEQDQTIQFYVFQPGYNDDYNKKALAQAKYKTSDRFQSEHSSKPETPYLRKRFHYFLEWKEKAQIVHKNFLSAIETQIKNEFSRKLPDIIQESTPLNLKEVKQSLQTIEDIFDKFNNIKNNVNTLNIQIEENNTKYQRHWGITRAFLRIFGIDRRYDSIPPRINGSINLRELELKNFYENYAEAILERLDSSAENNKMEIFNLLQNTLEKLNVSPFYQYYLLKQQVRYLFDQGDKAKALSIWNILCNKLKEQKGTDSFLNKDIACPTQTKLRLEKNQYQTNVDEFIKQTTAELEELIGEPQPKKLDISEENRSVILENTKMKIWEQQTLAKLRSPEFQSSIANLLEKYPIDSSIFFQNSEEFLRDAKQKPFEEALNNLKAIIDSPYYQKSERIKSAYQGYFQLYQNVEIAKKKRDLINTVAETVKTELTYLKSLEANLHVLKSQDFEKCFKKPEDKKFLKEFISDYESAYSRGVMVFDMIKMGFKLNSPMDLLNPSEVEDQLKAGLSKISLEDLFKGFEPIINFYDSTTFQDYIFAISRAVNKFEQFNQLVGNKKTKEQVKQVLNNLQNLARQSNSLNPRSSTRTYSPSELGQGGDVYQPAILLVQRGPRYEMLIKEMTKHFEYIVKNTENYKPHFEKFSKQKTDQPIQDLTRLSRVISGFCRFININKKPDQKENLSVTEAAEAQEINEEMQKTFQGIYNALLLEITQMLRLVKIDKEAKISYDNFRKIQEKFDGIPLTIKNSPENLEKTRQIETLIAQLIREGYIAQPPHKREESVEQ